LISLSFLLPILTCIGAAAQEMSAPALPLDVAGLQQSYVESVDDSRRAEVLEALAKTAPVSRRDLSDLFDLFMRFEATRNAVVKSLNLMDPKSQALESTFVEDLMSDDPDAQFFGLTGIVRLNDRHALPLILKITDRPMPLRDPRYTPYISKRKQWWLEYNALSVVAQWQGEQSLSLLKSRTLESPQVADIMAGYLWKDSLPYFEKWIAKSKTSEIAEEGLNAPVPRDDLRQTRPDLMKILRDPKANTELRHLIALKIGFSSTEEEIGALLGEYDAAKNPTTKLMLEAALFASRSRQVIPLLTQTVKENVNAATRIGALVELKGLLKKDDYKPILTWVSVHDADPDNRQKASEELASGK
jgi:hypothetical protein